ncbi:hypothetical protein ACQ4WX_46900 [Streptomyces lasalocidi]
MRAQGLGQFGPVGQRVEQGGDPVAALARTGQVVLQQDVVEPVQPRRPPARRRDPQHLCGEPRRTRDVSGPGGADRGQPHPRSRRLTQQLRCPARWFGPSRYDRVSSLGAQQGGYVRAEGPVQHRLNPPHQPPYRHRGARTPVGGCRIGEAQAQYQRGPFRRGSVGGRAALQQRAGPCVTLLVAFGGEGGALVEIALGDGAHEPVDRGEQCLGEFGQGVPLRGPRVLPQRPEQLLPAQRVRAQQQLQRHSSSARWAARSWKYSSASGPGLPAAPRRNSRMPCRAVAAISTSRTSAGSSG